MRPISVSAPLIRFWCCSTFVTYFNSVRQRTVGSPARDYVPALRAISRTRSIASKLFGMKEWNFDEKAEKAHEYRTMQQEYINKMLSDLKDRLAAGDDTPSILGNILRHDLLTDKEVLLASYTGSMFSVPLNCVMPYYLLTTHPQSLLA